MSGSDIRAIVKIATEYFSKTMM